MKRTKLRSFNFTTQNQGDNILNGVNGTAVTIPHTWNVRDGLENYIGTAWYSTCFQVDEPAYKTVLLFHAVYRDCGVFLNGKLVVEHNGSGYTPFEADVTDFITSGNNLLVIKCDSSYSIQALPYDKNFDWACDGGIIRPIELLEYSGNCAKSIQVESVIEKFGRGGKGDAEICCRVDLFENDGSAYELYVKENRTGKVIYEQSAVTRPEHKFCLHDITLWDTENPFLYTLELRFSGIVQSQRFGIRKIETRGNKVYLNNHEITLLAVEWMPGSNPEYGMAEPETELLKNLEMLKALNCNFTRFHWQQDDFVYDWCDENGLMVQEEIPYWGAPKSAGERELTIAMAQADEMLRFHYNHPSIVCWGVGNELDGWKKGTISYVQKMVSYFKKRDSMRLVNYVSNSLGHKRLPLLAGRKKEATTYGDICMWNEYLGTWYHEKDFEGVFRRVKNNCYQKPLVITEFGLCEPFFKGGDERRIEIYRQKLNLYEKFNVAGWVYFSLNDYRTHVGETGQGKFKQRIHGSVDINGNIKPSYAFIQAENFKKTKK